MAKKEKIVKAQTADIEPKRSIVASQRFADPVKSDRPVNVYVEIIEGRKVVWYTTESGKEEGRTPIIKRNEHEKRDIVVGYDYNVEATHAALEKIASEAYMRTKYYLKDGTHRREMRPGDILG